jgi:hypothetical protein
MTLCLTKQLICLHGVVLGLAQGQIYLITISIEHSHSRETKSHSARSEIPWAFYGLKRFITVFTTARHWSLFSARWIQFTTLFQPIYLRSILILASYQRQGLPTGISLHTRTEHFELMTLHFKHTTSSQKVFLSLSALWVNSESLNWSKFHKCLDVLLEM